MCPPATKSCPLDRVVKPEQKMFAPTCGAAVFVFVAGSHSVGLSPSPNGGHHSTLPVGRTWACVAIYGHVITDDHCPTVALVCAPADGASIKEERGLLDPKEAEIIGGELGS
jgi:hypothetical protein